MWTVAFLIVCKGRLLPRCLVLPDNVCCTVIKSLSRFAVIVQRSFGYQQKAMAVKKQVRENSGVINTGWDGSYAGVCFNVKEFSRKKARPSGSHRFRSFFLILSSVNFIVSVRLVAKNSTVVYLLLKFLLTWFKEFKEETVEVWGSFTFRNSFVGEM